MKPNKMIKVMRIIVIISMIISVYLVYLHYSDKSSFCDISKGLSCDIVNKSVYSEFPPGSGIPVSLMGLITFGIVLFLLNKIKKGNKDIKKKFSRYLFYLMIISLLFALYLVYAELVLILSICILCVTLDIFIISLLILSYKLWRCY